jgi:hypothetical protein
MTPSRPRPRCTCRDCVRRSISNAIKQMVLRERPRVAADMLRLLAQDLGREPPAVCRRLVERTAEAIQRKSAAQHAGRKP